MASVNLAIELQDNITNAMYQVINSVNTGISVMEDFHQTIIAPIQTTSFERVQASVNMTTMAVQALNTAMQTFQNRSSSMSAATMAGASANPVSAQWQSDRLEVFTNTGIDRFRQEAQSANNMIGQLYSRQSAIVRQAFRTNLLSPEAFQDLNQMATRINLVRERIQQIESNPLNLGTDAANAGLEHMRASLNQAVQEQQNLVQALQNMDVQAVNEAYLRLSQTIGSTERYIRDNVDEQGRFSQELEQGVSRGNDLINSIKGVVAEYANMQNLSKVMNLSDQLMNTRARLNLMNDGQQSTEDLENMIFLSAERSRGSYQTTMDAVSTLGFSAGDTFGSTEEIIAFIEQVNKQFAVSGTGGEGINAAMPAVTQVMSSGVLSGEEYNSLLQQAPNMIQTIAEYMGLPQEKLKDLAAEGQITADIVKDAMFDAAGKTNEAFDNMPMTFEQIWTSFENNALMAFQPILEKMNEVANSEGFQNLVNGAINGLALVAGLALKIFEFLVGVAEMIANNWSWLAPIIYGVAAALIVYYGWQMLCAVAAGITASTVLIIVMAVILLVAVFYAVVAAVNKFAGTSISATGIICGAFMTALAFIGNIIVALINFAIDIFVVFWNFIAAFANFFGNVFQDPVGAIARLFFDLCDCVLGLLETLASAIDTLFGSNLAGAVAGWRSSLNSWVDEKFGQGEEIVKEIDGEDWHVDRFDYEEAWDAGYSFGEGIDESIANFDPASLFGNNIPSEDEYQDLSNYGSGYEDGLSGIGNGNGIGSGIESNVNDIADNTGAMADAMEITGEELKYLRDIAEQEAINRFTTAEINIEQTNHNNVSSGMDLDGVVSGLDEALGEAIEIMTEGVHV